MAENARSTRLVSSAGGRLLSGLMVVGVVAAAAVGLRHLAVTMDLSIEGPYGSLHGSRLRTLWFGGALGATALAWSSAFDWLSSKGSVQRLLGAGVLGLILGVLLLPIQVGGSAYVDYVYVQGVNESGVRAATRAAFNDAFYTLRHLAKYPLSGGFYVMLTFPFVAAGVTLWRSAPLSGPLPLAISTLVSCALCGLVAVADGVFGQDGVFCLGMNVVIPTSCVLWVKARGSSCGPAQATAHDVRGAAGQG